MTRPHRGRPSPNDRVIPFGPGAHRLRSPGGMDPEARAIFDEIVASCPESHFVASDRQLLACYATALAVSRRASSNLHKNPSALATWEKASRLLATLASKLRLCPSSRADPKVIGRASMDHRPSFYDLNRGDGT